MEGTGGKGGGGIHVAVAKATEDLPRTVVGRKCPSYALQYCLLHHSAHRRHVDPMPRCHAQWRAASAFCLQYCLLPRTFALLLLHRCHVSVTHQRDTPQPRPTCETLPTGLRTLEGEGWPSQTMRWVAPRRRREPLCSGPCSAKTCGRQ